MGGRPIRARLSFNPAGQGHQGNKNYPQDKIVGLVEKLVLHRIWSSFRFGLPDFRRFFLWLADSNETSDLRGHRVSEGNLVRGFTQVLLHPSDPHPLHHDAPETEYLALLIITRKRARRQEPRVDKALWVPAV